MAKDPSAAYVGGRSSAGRRSSKLATVRVSGLESDAIEGRPRTVERTADVQEVLAVVRRVLREQTHWETWGRTLMAAIEAAVDDAKPNSTTPT